jgi:hypothetical protein
MRIFVLGLGKSGTTALVYKIAGGLPDCHAFSGGRPGKYLGDYENAVYKHIFEEKKGKSFELYTEHLSKEHYDRYIWIARDPRDAAVSRMLYRWHKGSIGNKKQYHAHLQLVLKKEQDPRAIPLYEICRYTGGDGWPISKEDVFKEEQVRHRHVRDFVQTLRSDWFLFTYEEMVAKSFAALNDYLGFEVEADAEVPISTGKAKVIRKKAVGDWRHWFTEQDVELFKPIYTPYMELIGYDCQDWTLSPQPIIEPEYSSMYMQRLVRRKSFPSFLSFKDRIIQRLTKG